MKKTIFALMMTSFCFVLVGCASVKEKDFVSEGPPNLKIILNSESVFLGSKKMSVHFYEDLPGCQFRDLGVLWIEGKRSLSVGLPYGKSVSFNAQVNSASFFWGKKKIGYNLFYFKPLSPEQYELQMDEDDGSLTQFFYQLKAGVRKELENHEPQCEKFSEVE